MSEDSEVIVLRDEVSSSDLLALAGQEAWVLRGETARAHLVLASHRWEARDGLQITHVADHPGGAHWLKVEGAGVREYAASLRERLPHHREEDLLALVLDGEDPDAIACIRVASKLAACRPAVMEPRHLAALERLLTHSETAVRRAGIRSAYTCAWPQLLELVRGRRGREARLADQIEHLERYLAGEADSG